MTKNRAISKPTFRLRGAHETGCSPGTAPPEAPSQPTTGNVLHAELGKACLMLPCAPNVGDHLPTAWTQHPHRFIDRLLAPRTSPDVVDRQAGDYQIKAVVLKG